MKASTSAKSISILIAAGTLLAACHSNDRAAADRKMEQTFAPHPEATATPPMAAPALATPAPMAEASAATNTSAEPSDATNTSAEPSDAIDRIKEEGLNHSHVMETLSYLSDVIGPRLTGSPNLTHAYAWAQSQFKNWGLTNVHLEPWGPFGRGWELKRFSVQIVEPLDFPVIAAAQAWSPGLAHPLEADVVYMGAVTTSNLDDYKGKLAGAIVLVSPPHDIGPRYDAIQARIPETNLLRLADASANNVGFFGEGQGARGGRGRGAGGRGPGAANNGPRRVTGPALLSFLADEKVGLVVSTSTQGDTGDIFVSQASVPSAAGARGARGSRGGDTNVTGGNTNAGARLAGGGRGGRGGGRGISVYSTNAPANIPPQITMAAEDYARLVRMINQGQKLKMAVDFQVQFYDNDLMAYDTIAEIPGTDLKDQIVMLGGHMDSWQAGTGATDNGAGVAACMEAVRILQACGLHPRRTIRVALWSGEEQGLLGSRAYVTAHFGSAAGGRGRGRGGADGASTESRGATRGPEFDKLSVYFNLDNGAGKIRGVFLQNNEAARPIFRQWLEPFRSLGAETLSYATTGSTDHISFDNVGLPGFQFLQDPLDYFDRTHHSSQDVFDRVQAADMEQASTIMAAFVYHAAMMPERFPRKPTSE